MASIAESSSSGTLARGIGCRVGKADIALPFASVGQIVEYDVFPLPLGRPFIGGLGLFNGWPLISIALAGGTNRLRAGSRVAKGITLAAATAGSTAWVLEVDELGAFLEVTVRPHAPSPGLGVPPWISQANASDGRAYAWIDVPAMLADFHTQAGQPG
jgi:hypothetical protein